MWTTPLTTLTGGSGGSTDRGARNVRISKPSFTSLRNQALGKEARALGDEVGKELSKGVGMFWPFEKFKISGREKGKKKRFVKLKQGREKILTENKPKLNGEKG